MEYGWVLLGASTKGAHSLSFVRATRLGADRSASLVVLTNNPG